MGNWPFVYMMVADMLGDNIETEDDEIIVVKHNINSLYGEWLANRHQFTLIHYETINPTY